MGGGKRREEKKHGFVHFFHVTLLGPIKYTDPTTHSAGVIFSSLLEKDVVEWIYLKSEECSTVCKVPSHTLSTPLSFLTSRNLSSEMSRSVVGTVEVHGNHSGRLLETQMP